MGSSSNSEMAFLQKKFHRHSAAAASVPNTSAINITSAASLEVTVSRHQEYHYAVATTLNQRSVRPCGGKLNAASSVLNA